MRRDISPFVSHQIGKCVSQVQWILADFQEETWVYSPWLGKQGLENHRGLMAIHMPQHRDTRSG